MRNVLIDGESLCDAYLSIIALSKESDTNISFKSTLFPDENKIIDIDSFISFTRSFDPVGYSLSYDPRVPELKDSLRKLRIFDSLFNVIACIILWDDVYVFDERGRSEYCHSAYWFEEYETEFKFSVLDSATVRKATKKQSETVAKADSRYNAIKSSLYSYLADLRLKDSLSKDYPANKELSIPFELYRAIYYYRIANSMNMDYMPSARRQAHLDSFDLWNWFARIDILNKLDDELNTYYKEVNDRIGRKRINYQFPVLLDYVLQRYKSAEDVAKGCFELHYDKEVVKFRDELRDIEQEFKSGNVKYIDDYFATIERIVKDISKRYSTDRSVNVTIGLTPSVGFDIKVPSTKPFQCSFLKDLSYYGIRNRIPRHYC